MNDNQPYIPLHSINLKDKEFTQIRLGLQGDPGTGKTYSSVKTFPNVVVADFDNGLNKFALQNVTVIPFYDENFVASVLKFPSKLPNGFANTRDAFIRWLQDEGLKLQLNQTLVVDSWTALQNAFDIQQDTEPKMTKENKPDEFHFWQKKIDFSERVVRLFKACKCHIVATFHEDKIRNPNTGQLVDKIGPLMQGKFVLQLKSHFTDWFRTVKIDAKTEAKITSEEYKWQVRGDSLFDAKTKLTFPEGIVYVEPSFEIFNKYK